MYKRLYRQSLLLALIFGLLLVNGTPVSQAQQPQSSWVGWGLKVDLRNQRIVANYTVYYGVSDPNPRVVDSVSSDISKDCQAFNLSYTATGATFNGTSSYIACDLPSWGMILATMTPKLPQECECEAGRAPFVVGTLVKLDPGARSNPLLDARDLGLQVNLPTNSSGAAQTELRIGNRTFTSPAWVVNGTGNRVAMGFAGTAVTTIANQFNWLDYLTKPNWQTFFNGQVTGSRVGHWNDTTLTGSVSQPTSYSYNLPTNAARVYIGRNITAGSYFKGEISVLDGDPGCGSSQ